MKTLNLDHTFTERYLEPVLKLAQTAGKKVLPIYRSDFSVTYKDDQSPLTEADMLAHQIIVSGLEQLTPNIPIISEEHSDISWETRQTWQTYWLIDPIDGTKEFIKKNDEFTINIALVHQGSPVLGVIDAPALGVSYFASTLNKLDKNNSDDLSDNTSNNEANIAFKESYHTSPATRQRLPLTPLTAKQRFVVAASRSHQSPELNDYLNGLGDIELIAIGSSLKFCLIAEGVADIYPRLSPTNEWDTAAGQAIASATGAKIKQLNGQPLNYNQKESYLNPSFIVTR